MSSTNKTTNYELSQFVGSDKPAWLADYNTDMGKIDAGMKGNADAINVTDGKADTNATNIGTLANLNTSAKTDLVSAVNEVYTTAGTANSTATQASTNANSAKTEADALSAYLSITNTGSVTASVTGGNISSQSMNYALNTAGTLGKVYGRLTFTTSTTAETTVTIPVPAINVSQAITISSGAYYTRIVNNSFDGIGYRDMTINPNGNITLTIPATSTNARISVWLPPCLYFFTDFGDIVNPNA